MERKKGINLFFVFIALIIGSKVFTHIDFKNLTLKDPFLDIVYLVVFVISIYLLIKDFRKGTEKK